ncbi:zinc finger protein 549-like [Erinaceus europaeus]|uniref:Zinc finger protein 549-like n=1 Tax=Erinaceus europaeus TaxID=9365 RepID=A0ABM3W734_ERIEU|nr:zinc finger protein 549-like [Erinaceus europaeus]
MATAAQTDLARERVTFEDVAVYFSQDEWGILDDAQRVLYIDVMLDSLALTVSVGGQGIEAEEAPSEPSVLIRIVSQAVTSKPSLPVQKTRPCERCVEVAKDILLLAEHHGVLPGQESHVCAACGSLFLPSQRPNPHQRQWSGGRCIQRDNGTVLVSSCESPVSDNIVPCEEAEGSPSSLVLPQKETTHRGQSPHRNRKAPETPQERHRCSECVQVSKEEAGPGVRGDSPRAESPYKCNECGKSFIFKRRLLEHQRIHTGEKPHECPECGKFFRQRSTLSEHQKIHRKERPHKCSECEQSFIYKKCLIAHQRIHTGEKPYKCYECGKSFRQRSNLSQHQKCHSEERLYKCSECEKSFNAKKRLREHLRAHTGEKPHESPQRGKAFQQRSCLTEHLKCHSEEGPGQCSSCGKTLP